MRALLLVLILLAGQGARADWRGFYTPTARAPSARVATGAGDPRGICVQEILRAQLRHQIPGNLLLAIGLQEAGLVQDGDLTVWPWTVNVAGEGRYLASREAAESHVSARLRDGIDSIDVGCMQVNLRWHPDAFDSVRDGFDPQRNVDYAARLLKRLYAETGDWITAAGRYHSGTPDLQKAYLTRLRSNAGIANDRLAEFRSLANDGSGRIAKAAAPREPLPEGHFWTAWLTQRDGAGEGQGSRSLFARGALEPILPGYQKMF